MSANLKKNKSIFNYKILLLILGFSVIYHIINPMIVETSDEFNLIDIFEIANMVIVTIMAFIIAKKYLGIEIFEKSYLAFAISCAMWLIAEIIWQIYENVLLVYPYPSLADVFYFAFYPFSIYHLMKNIRYFKQKFDVKSKITIIVFPILVVLIYTIFIGMNEGEYSTGYFIGMVYAIFTGITLSLAIVGVFVFRYSIISAVWALLALGIFVRNIADVWYYYLEIFGQYTDTHVTNTMWFAGWMIITYALYLHKKAI